jgi:hypothetical protein
LATPKMMSSLWLRAMLISSSSNSLWVQVTGHPGIVGWDRLVVHEAAF